MSCILKRNKLFQLRNIKCPNLFIDKLLSYKIKAVQKYMLENKTI